MLQMYYLRTHVFSKQEKKFMETAMAFASDFNKFRITASTASPRAVLPSRSILSISKRNKRRKLLLSLAAGKRELSSKLWSRKRRRRFLVVVDNCRSKELLYKLQHKQYNRLIGSRCASVVPSINEPIEERQSTGDVVPGHRFTSPNRCSQQVINSSLSANGLRLSPKTIDSRRRTASYCMSSVEMERSLRSQRDKTYTEMPQRKGSYLHLLQSRSLESSLPTR